MKDNIERMKEKFIKNFVVVWGLRVMRDFRIQGIQVNFFIFCLLITLMIVGIVTNFKLIEYN